MGSYSVLNRPIGVLDDPIVPNIHIGPNSPPMAGIWAFDGGPHSGLHRTFGYCSPIGSLHGIL
nr:MAG TPA: hypothetical protein [Caudoviricetes sp.]